MLKRISVVIAFLALVFMPLFPKAEGQDTGLGVDPTAICRSSKWLVRQVTGEARIFFKRGTQFIQYGVIHLTDSYFRLNYGPNSGWGTSIILLPSFWSGGVYHQGAPVTLTCVASSTNLILDLEGTIGTLNITEQITLSPPINNSISASVTASVTGNVVLDNRPGEAFKLVMLSSMHISNSQWDTNRACVNNRCFSIPADGWIFPSPSVRNGSSFRLLGGTSNWKTNAPTVRINLGQSRQVAGWVTSSNDPNDDNVGLWANSDTLLTAWSYQIVVSRAT